jgi:8-oxo-dGTP pyrophosphatase MutT (NUDIX family)
MPENRKFKYRVAAIAVNQDRVLLYQTQNKPYWALPGGCVEHWEFSHEALEREILEETGYEIIVGDLMWTSEHLFKRQDGEAVHEIVFYYRVTFSSDSLAVQLESFEGTEGRKTLIFRWFEIHKLDSLLLYPEFLAQTLASPESHLRHLLHKSE